MSSAAPKKVISPYRQKTVKLYRDAGWLDVFPLVPTRTQLMADPSLQGKLLKAAPPFGFTGFDARTASEADHLEWFNAYPMANIGLHLREDEIGIDVDQYGEKDGVGTLAEIEEKAGCKFPPTLRSTSRGDSMAYGGKLIYRLRPEHVGLAWPGTIGKGIEILHAGHRYVMTYPSRNPDDRGLQVKWYRNFTDAVATGEVPAISEAAYLPEALVTYLTRLQKRTVLTTAAMSHDETDAWVSERRDPTAEPCAMMRNKLDFAVKSLDGAISGHDAMRSGVFSLVNTGNEGCAGLRTALDAFAEAWAAEATRETDDGELAHVQSAFDYQSSWYRALVGGIKKVAGSKGDSQRDECSCGTGGIFREQVSTGDVDPSTVVMMRKWHELGLADRMYDYFGHKVRKTTDATMWQVFDGRRWYRLPASDNSILRNLARKTLECAEEHELPLYDELPEERLKKDGTPDERFGAEPSMQELFGKWLGGHNKVASLNNMITALAAKEEVWARIEDFDQHPMLLNTASGVVDLTTGELTEHDPALMITQMSPVEYVPGTPCPKFTKFLERVQPDPEVREYLQRVIGYTLTGSTSGQAFFTHHGHGANGKSVFIEVLAALMGDYHQAMAKSALLSTDKSGGIPNDLARIVGKRMLVLQETNAGQMLDNERIKSIASGDAMTARYLNAEFFEFRPVGKVHIVTNFLPELGAGGFAMERRMHDIGWDVTIPSEEQNENLAKEIIAEELEGVLAWAVEGAITWHNQGGLRMPEAVKDKVQEHISASDPLSEWAIQHTSQQEGYELEAQIGYDDYLGWAKASNIQHPVGQRVFANMLVERGLAVKPLNSKGKPKRHPKNKTILISGLKLNATQPGESFPEGGGRLKSVS